MVSQETLQEKSDRIAVETGISTSTLRAIVDGETGEKWDPNQICDHGDGRGLVCINKNYYPDEYKQALDPEFSLRFAAGLVKKGEEWKFTLCSCIQTAKSLGVLIPVKTNASDLKPNAPARVGGLILLRYANLSHVAVITAVTNTATSTIFHVKEGNFERCRLSERDVSSKDSHIIGFWAAAGG